MKVAVVGAGRIGGNVARQLAAAGHDVTVSFARDLDALRTLANEIGAAVATPAEAVAGADVVVIAVPWGVLPAALDAAGSLAGKVVVDTTNQFGAGPMPAPGQTAAAFNAARMPGARYTKCFNTLTSAFQELTAHRDPPVVQWICGDDPDAVETVAGLVRDAGYAPVVVGGTADCAVMEAPRRDGAVYGEEYRPPEAEAVVAALRAGREIPVTPSYGSGPGGPKRPLR
jgi:predicted dinucleotide-binding enzyme